MISKERQLTYFYKLHTSLYMIDKDTIKKKSYSLEVDISFLSCVSCYVRKE